MKSFLIDSNDAGQRLDKFVVKVTSGLPKGMLYKAVRKKRIKLNHKRCDCSAMLREGDLVELYLNDEFFPKQDETFSFLKAPASLSIVYEDSNILLVDKPVGLRVHSDRAADSDSLVARIQHYLYQKQEYNPEKEHSFAPALCNRIDRNTQGIVIAAKNAPALRILNEKIKQRELEKYYLCVVHGIPQPRHAVLTGYWSKDSRRNKALVRDTPQDGFHEIVTEYTVLRPGVHESLVEVRLHTGRSHQIRAHMAHIGHPLVGDAKYGGSGGQPHQLLCAYKLRFCFQTDAGALSYLDGRKFSLDDVWFTNNFK